jgi:type I restriction enzyme S subunit
MKNSGVPWLLDIPETWGIRVLFQLAEQVKNKNKDLSEQNLLSLSYGRIKRKDINSSDGLLPESFDGYNIIEANDIVLRLTDLQNDHTSLRVGQSHERGIITSAYTTLRPSVMVWPAYLYYVLHAYDLIKGFYCMGSGVRQGLNYDEVKTIKLPFPSQAEQQAIAAYLDDQVAQIDSIIAEAQASIEEYRLWKSAVVFETVTKGLDPHVNMKKSSIPWIREIPSHWKISRIKNEFDNLDYMREPISAENRENKLGLYDYYGASGAIDKIDDYNVDEEVILIGEDGANLRMRNLPLVYRANGKIWVNNHAHILRVRRDNDYSYMAHMLEAGDYNDYITGAAQPKLSQANLMRFPICVPPRDEQVQIGKFLDERCSQMDAMLSEKAALIEDMEEYKRSLIYESVTGKRKVV